MKFILDKSKWICGNPQASRKRFPGTFLGDGETQMKNAEGFMCCLGQFSEQLIGELPPGITGTPASLSDLLQKRIPGLSELYEKNPLPTYVNTTFSRTAMKINDAEHTTVDEKIEALKKLFIDNLYEFEVIN